MEALNAITNENKESSFHEVKRISTVGKVTLAITGGIGVGISVICLPFLLPVLRKHCLPYVPATTVQINNIRSALKGNEKGKLLDIGSGDGRICISTSKLGIESHGVELNPWLVLYSKFNAFREGVSKQTKFFKKDLWKFNLSPYDHVVIFGIEEMMADIEVKFLNEIREGGQIIACRFPLPNLMPQKIIGAGIDTVWVYTIKKPKHHVKVCSPEQE